MKSSLTRFRWLVLIALFSAILGAKFIEIAQYGSELPYWDQWDGEGYNLYAPYAAGRLTASDLIAPHNEHRILATRLLALGLFAANDRQWDVRMELVANAVIHAGVALLLAGFALETLPWGLAAAFAAVAALFFSSAVDWENTLGGFQSQFYFLLLFFALHLGGTLLAKPRSLAWWLAPLAGAAAIFAMGSGALSAPAILVAIGLRMLRDRKRAPGDLWVIGINTALLIAGCLLRVHVVGNDPMGAATLPAFIEVWLYQLAWPVSALWAAPLGLLPPLILGWAYFRRRVGAAPVLGLLGACAWYWMQAGAIAYARGGILGHGYASRYIDILIFGVLVNLLALATVAVSDRRAGRWRWTVLTALFAGLILAGLAGEDIEVRRMDFPSLPRLNEARIGAVRAYLASHDFAALQRTPPGDLPYPLPDRLAQALDMPVLRDALTASLRPPVAFSESTASSEGFSNAFPGRATGKHIPGLRIWTMGSPGDGPAVSAHFLSEPFRVDHRLVSIFVAGDGAEKSVRLRLIDGQGRPHEPLDRGLTAGARWKRVNFIAPKGQARLEVSVTGRWFAFTEPVTGTVLSHLAGKIAGSGRWLLAAGGAFYLIALISARRRKGAAPSHRKPA